MIRDVGILQVELVRKRAEANGNRLIYNIHVTKTITAPYERIIIAKLEQMDKVYMSNET